MKRTLLATMLSVWFGVTGVAGAAQGTGHWQLLGRKEVDFRAERDRVEVRRKQARFKQLRIRVEGSPVEMREMVVTFRNNETFKRNLRHRFDLGQKSRVIDLPDRRTIKHIDFQYRSINRRSGKAKVSVYGR